jgi:predicted dehydrogenase
MTNKEKTTVSRRDFLSSAAMIGATGALGTGSLLTSCSGGQNVNKLTPLRPTSEVYIPELPDMAVAGKPVRAALVGCGARGTGAAVNFLNAADGVSIVACADLFKDRQDNCRKILKEKKNHEIADDRCFVGFDAFKKACDAPDIDVVLIATPTLFHPDQLKFAVDCGKHVFCEKPAAIDAAGYRKYMMAVKQAQAKNLCIVTGTHFHHHRGYVEAYKMIQEGHIGRIVAANVYYMQGHLDFKRRQPEWKDMEYMFRDFFSWNWLSGDCVVDQLIHEVDIFTWFSHLKPVKAFGTGACLRRATGNIYDCFSVDFEYEGGIHVHGIERQIDNCDNRTGEIIVGTKGVFDNQNGKFTIVDHDGNLIWKYDEEAAKAQFKQHDPYVLEHVNLINHIRQGKVINFAETTATSSMACIMARESAYTGRIYSWDETTQSDMNFMPAELTLDNADMKQFEVIPLPGTAVKL